jgi:hypothetical protein
MIAFWKKIDFSHKDISTSFFHSIDISKTSVIGFEVMSFKVEEIHFKL